MKILFLSKSLKTPSTRIRVAELLPLLELAGFDCCLEFVPKNPITKYRLFKSARDYSAVILQKIRLSPKDLHTLRQYSKYLIYDFDDAVYLKNTSSFAGDLALRFYKDRKYFNIFQKTLEVADHLVVANKTLAKFAEKMDKDIPITLIPSTVSINQKMKSNYELASPPVIGWVGIKENLKYIRYIAPSLQKLADEKDFILRIISNGKISISGVNVECLPWKLETQYNEIKKFDIGIMPLSDNPFARGKSSYKLLQYMNIAVPSVASPVGMNREVSKNETACLTAETVPEFLDKILLLLNNIELRKTIAANGRNVVEKSFSREYAANLWCALLRACIQRKNMTYIET